MSLTTSSAALSRSGVSRDELLSLASEVPKNMDLIVLDGAVRIIDVDAEVERCFAVWREGR